jgi:hypothetical protein
MTPIQGVAQLAAVLRDAIFDNTSHNDWRANLHAKVQGSWNLHCQLTATLDLFIMSARSQATLAIESKRGTLPGIRCKTACRILDADKACPRSLSTSEQ